MRNGRILFVLAISLVACGPKDRDNGNGGVDGNTGGGDGNTNQDNCSEEAKLVYTVDENNTLSTFDPTTKIFTDLGELNCPAQFGASPFSMGIDRNAGAWVLYSSSELFQVDTKTLACTKTSWSAPNGLVQFGMGYSTDVAGGSTDTLFIAGGAGPTQPTSALNKLDTSSMSPQMVGTVTGWPELTGTGNAELWGFFPSAGTPRIEQIDKSNGSAARTFPLPTLSGEPTAWAFAFYGGDFWVFLAKDLDLSTTIYQVDGMNGTIKGMTSTGSRTIVGAGVSTCAPVVIF
ncbi:MAG TPA: hypothetical protein VFQ53_02865 [Kofleriaceae bacterium]|nr:hypothetical protein [Kofleriaceae bacterium]